MDERKEIKRLVLKEQNADTRSTPTSRDWYYFDTLRLPDRNLHNGLLIETQDFMLHCVYLFSSCKPRNDKKSSFAPI